jgi:hypothetical protein
MRRIFLCLSLLLSAACSTRSGFEMMAENDRNTLSQVCVMNESEQAKRVLRCGFADARNPSALAQQKGKRAKFSAINFK